MFTFFKVRCSIICDIGHERIRLVMNETVLFETDMKLKFLELKLLIREKSLKF